MILIKTQGLNFFKTLYVSFYRPEGAAQEAGSEPAPSAVAGALAPPPKQWYLQGHRLVTTNYCVPSPKMCISVSYSRVIMRPVGQDGYPCLGGNNIQT